MSARYHKRNPPHGVDDLSAPGGTFFGSDHDEYDAHLGDHDATPTNASVPPAPPRGIGRPCLPPTPHVVRGAVDQVFADDAEANGRQWWRRVDAREVRARAYTEIRSNLERWARSDRYDDNLGAHRLAVVGFWSGVLLDLDMRDGGAHG